jgi:hypothetical protein
MYVITFNAERLLTIEKSLPLRWVATLPVRTFLKTVTEATDGKARYLAKRNANIMDAKKSPVRKCSASAMPSTESQHTRDTTERVLLSFLGRGI